MTAKELQRRNGKSENLRVLQTEDGSYYVESSEGKILYNVVLTDDEISCTCGDWSRNSKRDSNFRCKHILSVINCVPKGEVEGAHFLDRKKPQLDPRFIISIDGHDFVKYQGLLDLGHQKGISQIEVDTVQLPTTDNGNFAICKATVVSKNGESFTDLGDATPQNCSSNRYIGRKFMTELDEFQPGSSLHLYERLKSMPLELPYIRKNIREFIQLIDPLIADAEALQPAELIQLLRSALDFDRFVTDSDLPSPDDVKIENLNQLVMAASRFKGIQAFIDYTGKFQDEAISDTLYMALE